MSFKHQLSFSEEEAFLFYFRHHNEPAFNKQVELWQQKELQNETPLESKKINMVILLTLITRFLIHEGLPSASLFEKTEFLIKTIYKYTDFSLLQAYEKQLIHEYFHIYLLKSRKTDNLVVNHILNYLYVHLHEKISLEGVSNATNTSQGHCCHVFKETMAYSIMEYHTRLKVERAQFFLQFTEMSLIDIGLLLGFHDQSHFSKSFKKIAGVTPKNYRLKHNL